MKWFEFECMRMCRCRILIHACLVECSMWSVGAIYCMFNGAFTCMQMHPLFCRNTTWLPLPVLRMRLQLFCNKITRVQGNPYSFFCTALTQIAITLLSLQSLRFLILTISIITIFLFIKALGYHCELSFVYYFGQCYQISTITVL